MIRYNELEQCLSGWDVKIIFALGGFVAEALIGDSDCLILCNFFKKLFTPEIEVKAVRGAHFFSHSSG